MNASPRIAVTGSSLLSELFDLSGRAALVTGATKGLGKEIALTLASAGADVALCSRTAPQARETAAAIAEATGRRTLGVGADVGRQADVQRLVREAEAAVGPIDILVASAGVNVRKPVEELAEADWDLVLDANLKGAFLCAQAVFPGMRRRRYGRIVFLGSILSFISMPGRVPYASSKAGLLGLTRTLALEGAADGVCVNALCPGPFDTPMNLPLLDDPDKSREFVKQIPVGRWGQPGEIRGVTLLLCSQAASFITGAALMIDGGWTVR